jgi:hypothetical protein
VPPPYTTILAVCPFGAASPLTFMFAGLGPRSGSWSGEDEGPLPFSCPSPEGKHPRGGKGHHHDGGKVAHGDAGVAMTRPKTTPSKLMKNCDGSGQTAHLLGWWARAPNGGEHNALNGASGRGPGRGIRLLRPLHSRLVQWSS